MSIATPRRIRTRERLLDAALAVFAERGVGSATVEQVCERAGFTRGAFYSNFDSWDELYLEVLRRECARLRDCGGQATERLRAELATAPGQDAVALAVSAFVRATGHDAAHVLALVDLRLHATRNPVLWPGFVQVKEQTDRVLGEVVRQTLTVARLRLRVEPQTAVEALTCLYESIGVTCVMSGEDFTERVTTALSELLRALVA